MREEIEKIINEELDNVKPIQEESYENVSENIEKQVKEQNEKINKEVVEITEEEFSEKIKTGKVLVDCYANWCGPCKMLSPIIDEIATENTSCTFYKLDVDNAENIAREYKIMSIPTLLFFEDGILKATSVGLKSKSEIEAIIE